MLEHKWLILCFPSIMKSYTSTWQEMGERKEYLGIERFLSLSTPSFRPLAPPAPPAAPPAIPNANESPLSPTAAGRNRGLPQVHTAAHIHNSWSHNC